MRRWAFIVLVLLTACRTPEEKAAYGLLRRTFGYTPSNVSLVFSPDTTAWYSLEVSGGRLKVEGSSTVALCKGFHDYIQEHGYGCVTWSGVRLDLPNRLPEMERIVVKSPFKLHQFFNVCTFGYTTPFWDWERWDRELCWCALHGFDMLLAPVGTEAVMYKVWEQQGLSQEEIDAYFTGPAHLPWMRMGNMSGMDGGLSKHWRDGQIALQHKILMRMKELGMTPVFQAFAGFVPQGMQRLHPEVTVSEVDWWGHHNWLIAATDPLFKEIGNAFIREWEAEFGKGKYYLADMFNENDIPFGERGTQERAANIRNYAAAAYQSIAGANPDATWVMQGWMFGRDRKKIWDKESARALLEGAPDDKLLVVDLAVDFNEFVWKSEKTWDYLDGFFGKPWIYSTTPNFGGRNNLKGDVGFYLNDPLKTLSSPNRGRLVGYGCAPEGIESNEIIYEAISAAAWKDTYKDPHDFLREYFTARYGSAPEGVVRFGDALLKTVHSHFTANDTWNWQRRPGHDRSFREDALCQNQTFFNGVRDFLSAKDELSDSPLYRQDALQYAAMGLGAWADSLYRQIYRGVPGLQEELISVLDDADRLLESHPVFRLQRWLDFAANASGSPQEQVRFRREAIRIITTWEARSIWDYSGRFWSGLLRDYYIPRLKAWFGGADVEAIENRDRAFVDSFDGVSYVEPFADPLAAADSLYRIHIPL